MITDLKPGDRYFIFNAKMLYRLRDGQLCFFNNRYMWQSSICSPDPEVILTNKENREIPIHEAVLFSN